MVRSTYPNKPGDFEVDGVSVIILPDKIIIDTGGRRNDERRYRRDDDDDDRRHEKKKKPEPKKERGRTGNVWNDILDNAEDIVMGRKKV